MAKRYQTDHHELTIQPSLKQLLPDLVWHLDEPSDPLSLCAWHVAKLARQYVKVAIGGDGGDELFGGYDRYYGNLYAGYYGKVPRIVRRQLLGPALTLLPAAGWYKSVGHQLRWLHRLSFLDGSERYAASLSYFYFDHERRASLFTNSALNELADADAENALKAPFEALQGLVGRSHAVCGQQGAPARSPGDDQRSHEHGAWVGDAQSVHGP